MELAQSILTGLLYSVIYGFSTLLIFQFILEISVAFEKHCNNSAESRVTVTGVEKSNPRTSKSENNQEIKTNPLTVEQLRNGEICYPLRSRTVVYT